jgi:hypothetical protein
MGNVFRERAASSTGSRITLRARTREKGGGGKRSFRRILQNLLSALVIVPDKKEEFIDTVKRGKGRSIQDDDGDKGLDGRPGWRGEGLVI